ncbi:MAG TPA: hypothetical protein VHO43_18125 [Ignavibacteriales bacterium]|nr:hypothetical protein [Ignavibacteriales bacterium]
MGQRKHCTYIFTIQRAVPRGADIQEISDYLALLNSAGCDVIVVDGSPLEVYAAHEGAWFNLCRHVKIDSRYRSASTYVNSIYTGAALAVCQRIIAASEKVRYTPDDVLRMCELLEHFELVRPQNYLFPLNWWSQVESAGILVNRTVFPGGDSPETIGFLGSTFHKFCSRKDKAFDQTEDITRQFIMHQAKVCFALDFLIQKNSPPFNEWCTKCFRETYKNFSFSLRPCIFLLLIPMGILLQFFFGTRAFLFYCAAVILSAVTIAFLGRFRGGRRFFPLRLSFAAPAWLMERILCHYKTLFWLLRPGGHPSFANSWKKKSRSYHIKGPVKVKLLEGNRKTEKN